MIRLFRKKNRPASKKKTGTTLQNNDPLIAVVEPAKNRAMVGRARPESQDRDWGLLRINVVAGIFCLIWVVLLGRAWYLQIIDGPSLADRAYRQYTASVEIRGRRGMILDRDGQILARSVEAKSVYAKPREIVDQLSAAQTLAGILNEDAESLYKTLSRTKRNFVYLKRKVDDHTADQIRHANMAGIGLQREYVRIYPFRHMAGQLLGFVGMDDKGLEGLEHSMNSRLSSMPIKQVVQRDARGRLFYMQDEAQEDPVGEDVRLTIDVKIQYIAEKAVEAMAREYDARWGGALVVDVPTGDILAWAQYPFFNPNQYREASAQIYRNRLAADALEPGSTFKPFVMAAALQEKKVSPGTVINCENGKWTVKNFSIRDTSTRGDLPASKVIRYSSNIGMAKIGLALGAPLSYKYLHALGFGERTNVPVSDSRGILRRPRDWSEIDIMATSFGQSVSVTGLQMAQAYLTILNGGIFKPLRLVQDGPVEERYNRIFSERTCKDVIRMLREVVQENDGTGKRARIENVEVGGKTGTAQKADRGTYGSKRLASFVGFLPADKPQYLILVMADEPSKNQFGGVVAAPAFQQIASNIFAQSGMDVKYASSQPVADKKVRKRGLKLSGGMPLLAGSSDSSGKGQTEMASMAGVRKPKPDKLPDVKGKSVRNAVEVLAAIGIVPDIKGSGNRVIRQTPPAGSLCPPDGDKPVVTIWLSET